jgi:ABC-2 type transport system permease protein
VLTIYRREIAGLFFGPLAWLLLALAFLLNGYLFVFYLKFAGGDVDVAIRASLGESWPFWALLILFPPLLTMRMISEESRTGLLEFLLTAPVSDAAVVVGKFLAAVTFLGILWACIFIYAFTLARLGMAPDPGVLVGGWIGALLVSGFFCAIGLFASSLTNTPVLSAFAAVLLNLAIVISPLLAQMSGQRWLRNVIERIDVLDHHKNAFMLGVLDSSYVVFFVAWTGLFLFMTVRMLEARRWR